VLVAIDKYVLMIDLYYEPYPYNAALKLGQYIKRNIVPQNAIKFEL